jgi:peroxiredoxin
MGKEALSRAYLRAGDKAKAEQTAKEAVDQGVNRVYPLANYVEILQQAGKTAEATEAFKKLQAISGSIDMQAPIFQRLAALAPQLGLPAEWKQPLKPADDVGQRPELESLGPFRWAPSPAAEWSLPNAAGEQVSLSQFRGKPVVVIFYLGFGCLHCVEQLKAFAPLQQAYADAGISLIGISSESIDLLKAGLAKRAEAGETPLPIPLVSNEDLSIFKQYRCFDDFESLSLHGTFLIDADGLIRWQDISYEPFTDAKFLLGEAKRLLGK